MSFSFGGGAPPPKGGIPGTGIWQAFQNLVTAVTNIGTTLAKSFPQVVGNSTTATGGSATLPGNPVGFMEVVNPTTGTTVKVPYYNT